MKKLVLLTIALLLATGAALYAQVATKVAILPVTAIDSNSRYIQRILTKRDFRVAFEDHEQYDMLDMKAVERGFKRTGYRDVEGLNPDEMKEVAEELGADILVLANVSTMNASTFRVSARLYSPRSNELSQFSFNVVKERRRRFASLQESFITEIDRFFSTEVQKLYDFAQTYYVQGNFGEAETTLNNVISLDPEKKEAYLTLGEVYMKSERYPQAETIFERALELDPNYDQALLNLVELYELSNQPAKKIQTMSRIADKNSDHELWFNIGNLYAEQGNNDMAVRAFRRSLEIEPDFALAQYRLAFLLYDQGSYSEAIEYLETAANEYPDNELISRRLALAYQRSGRIDDAITRYEAAIENNPSNVQSYLNVVSLYRIKASESNSDAVKQEMNQKAINLMNRLIQNDPNNALGYLNLASIYLAQSSYNNAETNANLAITKDSNLYLPYIILATVSQSRGTDSYNSFVDLEQRAARAVGNAATNLRRQRDAAKTQANTLFRRAMDQLASAKARTNDPEIVTDINERMARVQNLINQTSGY